MKRLCLLAAAVLALSAGLVAATPSISSATGLTAGQSANETCPLPNHFTGETTVTHTISGTCNGTLVRDKCQAPNAFANFSARMHFLSADCVAIPSGSTCTTPLYSSTDPMYGVNIDPPPAGQFFWVNNDAWSGTRGPQQINICSEQSWSAGLTEPNNGDQVETYPNTEYDLGGRSTMFSGVNNTTPISGFTSISSTFAESNPKPGDDGWDAGYDLWSQPSGTTGAFVNETMVWNDWQGANAFWATATPDTAVTIGGVNYHFHANNWGTGGASCTGANEAGCEYIFTADTQTSSGTIDALGFWNWEVANGYANASDEPAIIQYGTEVSYTGATAPETFNTTGLTVSEVGAN